MRFIFLSTAIAVVATATSYASAAEMAAAKLSHGMTLMVMDSAVSCNGGPGAFVHDKAGKKIDQTCNVHFTPDGVRVLFAGYGKPIFFSKDQFTVVEAP